MGQQRSKSTEVMSLCTSLTQPSRLDIMYILTRSLQRSSLESAWREEADGRHQLAAQDGSLYHLEPCKHGE